MQLVQVLSSCAESVAKISQGSPKHRNAASKGAAFAIGVGVFLVIFSASLYLGETPTQDEPLTLPTQTSAPTPTTTPTATPSPTATPTPEVRYPIKPKQGDKVGTVSLPTLKLSWPIFEGTTEAQLAKGVGHYTGSVLPGIKDNSVLSGHRMTVFNRLGELSAGDEILVKTSAGLFLYKVATFRVVSRKDQTVIVPSSTAVLTLTTCWPFDHVGKTYQAFIVRAKLVESILTSDK